MKKEKVIVACSGGPDSMVLLDMYKRKYDVCVCHINYHKRKTAKRDENIVRKYCKDNNIPFYKFDYKYSGKDNFQKVARDFRYDCFKKICVKLSIKKVLVAHHMDDHIETYLMQIKRKTSVSYYGISKQIVLDGMVICRPLLNKTKNDLLLYADKHNIPYGIDESNLSNTYERNRVRHSKVDKLSIEEKNKIIKEIENRNLILRCEIADTKKFINANSKYKYKDFINYKHFERLIRMLLYLDLSDKYIFEIKKALMSKDNIDLKVRNKYICKEYGYIYSYDNPYDYKFTFDKIINGKYDFFKISNSGNTREAVSVSKSDFPLTIRNFKQNDTIKMNYGTKKVNRFFIDKKISSFDRKIWPIVLNKNGEVILVPGLGCNASHYSSINRLYVIKL